MPSLRSRAGAGPRADRARRGSPRRGGERSHWLIEAPAGIGKTSLLRAARRFHQPRWLHLPASPRTPASATSPTAAPAGFQPQVEASDPERARSFEGAAALSEPLFAPTGSSSRRRRTARSRCRTASTGCSTTSPTRPGRPLPWTTFTGRTPSRCGSSTTWPRASTTSRWLSSPRRAAARTSRRSRPAGRRPNQSYRGRGRSAPAPR